MIHWKRKDFRQPPKKLDTQGCYKQIEKAVKQKDGGKYTNSYYRCDGVLDALRAYSICKRSFDPNKDQPKCYYCESTGEQGAALQVEHYRPKAKVIDDNSPSEDGYYWLGNEWSNLLLACSKCNDRSAKGNKFPILGARVMDHDPIRTTSSGKFEYDRSDCLINSQMLSAEQPLLLNPEIDSIIGRFSFGKDGQIYGHDDRAKETIKICNLNRKPLVVARKKIYDELKEKVKMIVISHIERPNIYPLATLKDMLSGTCKEIHNAMIAEKPYSLYAHYFNSHYQEFFLTELPMSFRKVFRECFASMK
ncbi:hypothetical protein K5X82_16850 [Halosquirtibacter xylanolyticus]|uniref:hypothetical protein n=1 Tax=Halosquirtibacter xylanolyticus TaxID=3374599 RepID=UPI003748A20D|nr:hypothetical protein K5X82_16850 [Prolixibacteraceae bacterium]